MKTLKITKIWIDEVEMIQVVQPKKEKRDSESGIYDESDSECRIIVTCSGGEQIEFILSSRYWENLALRETDGDWILPKVYKGSKED
jgi:hypothetical protein